MATEQKFAAIYTSAKQRAQPVQYRHQPMRSGALTVLIALVALSLAVLAVLAFTTARADLALTERRMQTVKQNALTESAAQEWLAQVAAEIEKAGSELTAQNAALLLSSLPGGATVSSSGLIQAKIGVAENEYISAALQITALEPRYEIVRWQLLRQWQPNEELKLWDGE